MCANVAYRAIGGIIPGTFDLVELLIIPAIGFALVTVEYQRRHTVVDMITTHLPAGVRSWLEIVVSIISLFYWAALCWAGWKMLLRKMATGETTQLLQTLRHTLQDGLGLYPGLDMCCDNLECIEDDQRDRGRRNEPGTGRRPWFCRTFCLSRLQACLSE